MNHLRNSMRMRLQRPSRAGLLRRLCVEPLESRSMMAADFSGNWFDEVPVQDAGGDLSTYGEFAKPTRQVAVHRFENENRPLLVRTVEPNHNTIMIGWFSKPTQHSESKGKWNHLTTGISKPSLTRPPASEPTGVTNRVDAHENGTQDSGINLSSSVTAQALFQSDQFMARGNGVSEVVTRPQAPLSLEVAAQSDGRFQERFLGNASNDLGAPSALFPVNEASTAAAIDSETPATPYDETLTTTAPSAISLSYGMPALRPDLMSQEEAIIADAEEVDNTWNHIHALLDNLLESRRQSESSDQSIRAGHLHKHDVKLEQQAMEALHDRGMIALTIAPAALDSLLDIQQQSNSTVLPDVHGLVADMGIYQAMEFAGLTLSSAQANEEGTRDHGPWEPGTGDRGVDLTDRVELGLALPPNLVNRSLLLPELALFSGLFFWLKRRRRQHSAVNPGTTS